jgi:hypothetical protein
MGKKWTVPCNTFTLQIQGDWLYIQWLLHTTQTLTDFRSRRAELCSHFIRVIIFLLCAHIETYTFNTWILTMIFNLAQFQDYINSRAQIIKMRCMHDDGQSLSPTVIIKLGVLFIVIQSFLWVPKSQTNCKTWLRTPQTCNIMPTCTVTHMKWLANKGEIP